MWQRLGEVCEEFVTADESRRRELWHELTKGELLKNGCEAGIDAGQEALPTLERCYELFSASAMAGWIKSNQRDAEYGERIDPGRRAVLAITILVALRCAEGEDRFRSLVDWLARVIGQQPPTEWSEFRPIVPSSAFAWVRGAFGVLDQRRDIERSSSRSEVYRELAQFERRHILATVHDPGDKESLHRLLSTYGPSEGLHFVELMNWPVNSPVQFPPANPIATSGEMDDAWTDLIRLAGSRNETARFTALLLIERCAEERAQGNGDGIGPHPPELIPFLMRLMRNDHPAIRGLCTRSVSRLGINDPGPIVRRLGPLLRDPVAAVRVEAARAALRLQSVTPSVVSGLAGQLSDARLVVRREAANAVAGLGSRIAKRCILAGIATLLREEDVGIGYQAARAARALAAKATPAIRSGLVHQLTNQSNVVRAESLGALAAAGARFHRPEVIRGIRARFVDDAASVRLEAVRAYDAICLNPTDPPTELIAARLTDDDWEVQLAAIKLVGRLGRRVMCFSTIEGLAQLLMDRCQMVSEAALIAVAQFGPSAATSSVIAGTFGCLLEGSRQACQTVEQLEVVPQICQQLASLLRSPDRKQFDRLIGALIRVNELACWPALLDELLVLLNDDSPICWSRSAYALEWLGPNAATRAILDRLEELRDDHDADVRFHVNDALMRLAPPSSDPTRLPEEPR